MLELIEVITFLFIHRAIFLSILLIFSDFTTNNHYAQDEKIGRKESNKPQVCEEDERKKKIAPPPPQKKKELIKEEEEKKQRRKDEGDERQGSQPFVLGWDVMVWLGDDQWSIAVPGKGGDPPPDGSRPCYWRTVQVCLCHRGSHAVPVQPCSLLDLEVKGQEHKVQMSQRSSLFKIKSSTMLTAPV